MATAIHEHPASRVANFFRVLRKIIGVPDYETYVEHQRCAHPDREPMSRRDFENLRMQDKYTKPGGKCC